MLDKFLTAAIVLFSAFLIFVIYTNYEYKNCEESGGFWSRGFWGYECVQRK